MSPARGGLIGSARSQQVLKEINELKPGEFTWHPERSPAGSAGHHRLDPRSTRARLSQWHAHRRLDLFDRQARPRDADRRLHVLEKDKNHHSSTYNDAPMPNMNRLTWRASRCTPAICRAIPLARLHSPAAEIFRSCSTVTHVGTPVIIAGSHSDPREVTHPGLVLGGDGQTEFADAVSKLKGRSHPADWSDGQSGPITSVVISGADRTATLLENGSRLALGALEIKGEPKLGEHVFVPRSDGIQPDALAWHGVSHHPDPAQPNAKEEALISRVVADADFREALRQSMHPGMLLIVTDLPSGPDTRSGSDFVIMSTS